MPGVRQRGERIREFIQRNLSSERGGSVTSATAGEFGISRQAVHHHIRRLVDDGLLEVGGTRAKPTYRLLPLERADYHFALDGGLEEHVVWRDSVFPHVRGLPENVVTLWEYGVTEMVNNAIDHSEGSHVSVWIEEFRFFKEMYVIDNGIGIFKKIKNALNLDDERHAVLELAKGKFTTDPDSHSGEGIFFSSRMFDEFDILSGEVFYSHQYGDSTEWISQAIKPEAGTTVCMRLDNDCARTAMAIFDAYAGPEDYEFAKTVVPVTLALYGDGSLTSRSQAKRVLTRVDRFTSVIFDFEGVDTIGQAFADEVFRVFASKHPEIDISYAHANPRVKRMITRALAAKQSSVSR